MSPKISVIMATYNHARYVAQAIRSVLDQSFSDFEFLIVDDGSQDETASVVAGFVDPRIRFIARTENRGSAASRNELIRLSRGQYIAVQNSDDYWPLDKLAYQFEFLENNPDFAAIFGQASFVDQNGILVPNPSSVFDQGNRSPALWLRRFLEASNCLCHPTVMLRRACQMDLGEYDRRYRQLPDMDMWVRLSKKYRLFVSDRPLAFFRLHDTNVSNPTNDVRTRFYNDQYLIASSLFDGMSKDLLVDGFRDLLMLENPPSETHCDIEKALVYFKVNSSFRAMYQVLGLKRLYDLLASPVHRQTLVEDYGIDELAFNACRPRRTRFAKPSRRKEPSSSGQSGLAGLRFGTIGGGTRRKDFRPRPIDARAGDTGEHRRPSACRSRPADRRNPRVHVVASHEAATPCRALASRQHIPQCRSGHVVSAPRITAFQLDRARRSTTTQRPGDLNGCRVDASL